jgi:hypothetical protein
MAKNWIQDAIQKPGALKQQAKQEGFSSATTFARKVLASPGKYSTKTVKRARLALTLAKLRKKK